MDTLDCAFPLAAPRRVIALGLGPELNVVRISHEEHITRVVVPAEISASGVENALTWIMRRCGAYDAVAVPLVETLTGPIQGQQRRAIEVITNVCDARNVQCRVWPLMKLRPRVWPLKALGYQELTPMAAAAVLANNHPDGAFTTALAAALLEHATPTIPTVIV